MAPPSLSWLSTTLANREGLVQMGFELLGELASTAQQITVVAAYWDEVFLNRILEGIPSTKRGSVVVRVFVNGFTGQRGADDARALVGIMRAWRRRRMPNLSIALLTGSRLFHSKVLVFESAHSVTVYRSDEAAPSLRHAWTCR